MASLWCFPAGTNFPVCSACMRLSWCRLDEDTVWVTLVLNMLQGLAVTVWWNLQARNWLIFDKRLRTTPCSVSGDNSNSCFCFPSLETAAAATQGFPAGSVNAAAAPEELHTAHLPTELQAFLLHYIWMATPTSGLSSPSSRAKTLHQLWDSVNT